MSVLTIIDDTSALGVPHVNLLSLCTILVVGFGLHFVFKRVSKRLDPEPAPVALQSAAGDSFYLNTERGGDDDDDDALLLD